MKIFDVTTANATDEVAILSTKRICPLDPKHEGTKPGIGYRRGSLVLRSYINLWDLGGMSWSDFTPKKDFSVVNEMKKGKEQDERGEGIVSNTLVSKYLVHT